MRQQVSDPRTTDRYGRAVALDLDVFLARLGRMSTEERVMASRYEFTLRERTVWAARFPDEVSLVNNEFEWIVATLE